MRFKDIKVSIDNFSNNKRISALKKKKLPQMRIVRRSNEVTRKKDAIR